MKSVIILLAAAFCSQAMAYSPGLYTCKNSDAALPPDTYRISNISMDDVTAPFVEVSRHYRKDPTDPNSEAVTASIKGFASLSVTGQTEVLMVGQFRMEFDNGVLFGCKAP